MAVHLLIVDALNLIRRIHAVQGSPCVDTCLHALEQLIVHSQPTHAVAVFDDEDRAHGWRHQRLPEYKAGRAPMPETLVAEMPALRAAFEQRGIRCWASPGSEADDPPPPGGEGGPCGPSGHHRLHRQRLLPAAVAHHPHPRLLSEALAGRPLHRQRVRRHPGAAGGLLGAGGDQQLEGAGRGGHWTQKRRPAAERVSGLEGLYARLAEVPEKWRKKLAAHQEMAFTCREVARLQTDLQLDGNLQQLRLTR